MTRAIATSTGPVLGYFSWGSNDPANQRRDMGLTFANGAIGGMYVSTDGRTFREPNVAWRPAVAGSATGGQSLVGDLIREGITGVSGHVAEPYLDAIIRPQILFPAYLSGFNLAESFYLAMPNLSWQDIVIGDPLCSPFGPSQSSVSSPIDPDTGLPARFAERQLSLLKSSNLRIDALKLFLKAQNLRAQERPEAEVLELLKQATALEPRLAIAQLLLALAAEAKGDLDDAIARYRAVIAVEPDNVSVLNNLAYILADQKNLPKEALPLAERAYRVSGQSAIVADTLGWAHYKNGDAAAALPYIDRAAKLEPKNVEILLHAATTHAELKDAAAARTYLDAALKLDPKLADRQDVKALILRIR
jgi:tetratricopeptide (TPR) repeat protein